jgi:hypothetical protein
MENIAFDTWLSTRMEFSAKDKRDCFETAKKIAALAYKVRMHGLLAVDNDIPEIEDVLLKKTLQLAVDSAEAETIRKIMQTHIVVNNYRGKRLLEAVLIKEGMVSIVNGANPVYVRDYLSVYFGDSFLQEYTEYVDIGDIAEFLRNKLTIEEFSGKITHRQTFPDLAGINLLEDTFRKYNEIEMRALLNNSEQSDLILAVKGSSEYVIGRILGNMSERNQEMFMQECMYLREVRRVDIIAAQNKILETGKDLQRGANANVNLTPEEIKNRMNR